LVYGKDYFPSSVWPGSYGLKPWIDNLIWIHEKLASGSTVTQYLDPKVIVLNRTGGPGLLTALNFDDYNGRTITCQTTFGANVQLHDYTGRHSDISTDNSGRATFTIPSNAYQNGQSYLCFSRKGLDSLISVIERSTTQVFFGASDLDIGPAIPGVVEVGKIWCAGGSGLTASLLWSGPREKWPTGAEVKLEVLGPAGTLIASEQWTAIDDAPYRLEMKTTENGWYTLRLTSSKLPSEGSPFELTVTYTASQGIAE
jgi:alpha-amylase